ncbi:hypothetical protein [Paenibacillus sp. Soil766]|uniref:hypothetical protein n=1 Tax=Paenibacillus sp. Soil766 TaxID=1736404 RepID=UPI0012F70D77|nr:hypothetical protein [Paenibacillus sp. Soil766]
MKKRKTLEKLSQEMGTAMGLEVFLKAFNENNWCNFVATCSKDVDENSIELGVISVPEENFTMILKYGIT